MNKRVYIQPTMLVHHVIPSTMICGSGGNTETMGGDASGTVPTPSDDGIITGEAKGGILGIDLGDDAHFILDE